MQMSFNIIYSGEAHNSATLADDIFLLLLMMRETISKTLYKRLVASVCAWSTHYHHL